MMGYAPFPEPLTARAFLFGGEQDAVTELSKALRSGDVGALVSRPLAGLGQGLQNAAVREVSSMSAGLLDIDLVYVLVAGWCKYAALAEAARRTAAAPGTEELVNVATHRVSAAHDPYIELLVDGVKVATVHVGLELRFDIKALVAGVKEGKLAAVHLGTCEIAASLSLQGVSVASRTTEVELPAVIRLGKGIPLLSDAQRARARSHQRPQRGSAQGA